MYILSTLPYRIPAQLLYRLRDPYRGACARLRPIMGAMIMFGLVLGLFFVLTARPLLAEHQETEHQEIGNKAGSPKSLYEVKGVQVDENATSANVAKQQALFNGQMQALVTLFQRIVPDNGYDWETIIQELSPSNVVESFYVHNEKTSSTRYIATLDVRFRPPAVRAVLRTAGIGFSEVFRKPLLVIPLLETDDALILWDTHNPWRTAWQQLPTEVSLLSFVFPHADSKDNALLSPTKAMSPHDLLFSKNFMEFMARYGHDGAVLAIARLSGPAHKPHTDQGDVFIPHSLNIELNQIEPLYDQNRVQSQQGGYEIIHHQSLSVHSTPEESLDEFYRWGARLAMEVLEDRWKRDSLVLHGVDEQLSVSIPINGLSHWLSVRKTLENLPLIQRLQVRNISLEKVTLALYYAGTQGQLRKALAQQDLLLEQTQAGWFIRN